MPVPRAGELVNFLETAVNGMRNRPPQGALNSLTAMVSVKWLAAPAIAALAAWTFFAGSDPKGCKVDVSRSSVQVCHSAAGPVNVEVKIDATMFRGDPRIARGAAAAAVRSTEIPVEYGGAIQVSAFGRSASRPQILFETRVPTRQELRLS